MEGLSQMLSGLVDRLRKRAPDPPARVIVDEPPVDRAEYLDAWNIVLGNESGRKVVAQLRYYLWAEAGETCVAHSIEQVAMFHVKHEGKMEILERIVKEATHNIRLRMPKAEPGMRPLGRAQEEV